MSNADKFLDCFNEIEQWLKSKCEMREVPFVSMINELKFKSPIVRRFFDDLYQFASLRNAIVHTRRLDKVIAEPHKETVELISKIKNELLNPPRVRTCQVLTVKNGDDLNTLLTIINEKNFSQVPIVDENDHVIEILTTNTIARWLAANVINDLISLRDTRVNDLQQSIEFQNNYRFVSQSSNLYEAANLYQSHANENGHNLDAVFITNSGNQNQKLIGIVCIEDIALFFNRN